MRDRGRAACGTAFLSLAIVLPIPSLPFSPGFIGAPATPHPITGVPATPQSPFMARNGRSEIHDDAWQTDAYAWGGPLGRSPTARSAMLTPPRECGSIAFDTRGRVVSICIGVSGPQLFMFDPATLATLAAFPLPARIAAPGARLFQDFGGGGYFYLDDQDRVVTATTTRHIYLINDLGSGGFRLAGDYDLSRVLTPGEEITSALPDSRGLLWFVARQDGVVGTLRFSTGRIHVRRLGHGAVGEIENSFATDEAGGVYIATNRKLYRFTAGPGGTPRISWQVTYPNSFEHKPGQVDDGTGTTPTVMEGGYVSISDNADPMDVVVYRVTSGRSVCRIPVFPRGAGDTENSLIVAGRSMIVENNYGYSGPAAVAAGGLTAPGFTRVDLNARGTGCRVVWRNRTERAPSVVPKLSLANGLIYTYTKDPGIADPWYWTAIDFRTGATVFKRFAGTGVGYNNNYAGIAIGPSGAEYLGALGGLITLRDRR